MTAFNPNETAKVWQAQRPESAVQLYLSGAQGDAAALIGMRVAGYLLHLNIVPVTDWIDSAELASAAAAVIQVDADSPASLKRFQKLAAASEVPLIAAAYEPPLALVRTLLRAGAHDVLPLPLDLGELEASLAPVREATVATGSSAPTRTSKVVSVIKSSGGVGATALLSQLAIRFAQEEARFGREACLIDFDVQFGDTAFQLGLRPKLSITDLIEAGPRLDGALMRSVSVEHGSGLRIVASPPDLLPLESITSEQVIDLVEIAEREFGTVFVDLPANWTNWSLSLLARSDIVFLITEMSVAALHRARRQLELLQSQDLDLDIRIVVNRHEKSIFRTIKANDVQAALGRDVDFTVSNDPEVMRTATDRGVPIAEVKRKSAVGKDIAKLESALAETLGLER